MKTNLQRFAELFKDSEGIEQVILDNFNNQDDTSYTLDGITYHIFDEEKVKDILDEDFDNEIYDFCYELEYKYPNIVKVIEANIEGYHHNYKRVQTHYDMLNDWCFEATDDEIYVYTEK
jgi:hypothetical protein